MSGEVWRPVEGWPPYEVSNLGRVRRLGGTQKAIKTRILKLYVNEKGYQQVHLRDCGREKNAVVHRLVALAFIGPPPSPVHQVAHYDGNGQNAAVSNLSWKTPAENNADKLRHGTHLAGLNHPSTRLSSEKLAEAKRLRAEGVSYSKIAAAVGCSNSHAHRIVVGLRRSAG